MKELFVGNGGRYGVRKCDIKTGFVTSLGANTGTVLFNDKTSAYFKMIDGCHVSFGTDVQAIKFTTAGDVKRPDMRDIPNNREIVAVLNRFNPDWVYVWAYPVEYTEALNNMADFREALDLEAEARNRESERRDREWRNRALEQEIRDSKERACRQEIDSLGFFRVMQAHKFREETSSRPARPATGPMKLIDLLRCIGQGKVDFLRARRKGENDTLFMWFERQVGDQWVKVDFLADEAVFLHNAWNGSVSLEEIQPIIDRLASTGVSKAELVSV